MRGKLDEEAGLLLLNRYVQLCSKLADLQREYSADSPFVKALQLRAALLRAQLPDIYPMPPRSEPGTP